MNDRLPDSVKEAMLLLNLAGYEAYLVGGAVRDLLMHQIPKDYDLATNATPEQMKKVFCDYHCIRTGMRHNTLTIHIQDDFIEITTYRNQCETIQEDLAYRDLTVNSIAYSLHTGWIDPYGGFTDIQNQILRFNGNGFNRIQEDPLRMLRVIRLSVQFHFSIDPQTWSQIQTNASLLEKVSKERIRDELDKILDQDVKGLELLYRSKLLTVIDPHLGQMFICDQNNPYHYTDVGHHTLDALQQLPSFIPCMPDQKLSRFEEKTIRYALLLHDIGKPDTKTTGEDGVDHFYDHPQRSVKIAQQFLFQYRFSKAEMNRILSLIQYHDYHLSRKHKSIRKMLVKHHLYPELMRSLLLVKLCDASAHCHSKKLIADILVFKDFYYEFVASHPYQFSHLKINGHTILALCPGLEGIKIPVIQQECLYLVLQYPEKNTKEELIRFIKKNQRRYRVMKI